MTASSAQLVTMIQTAPDPRRSSGRSRWPARADGLAPPPGTKLTTSGREADDGPVSRSRTSAPGRSWRALSLGVAEWTSPCPRPPRLLVGADSRQVAQLRVVAAAGGLGHAHRASLALGAPTRSPRAACQDGRMGSPRAAQPAAAEDPRAEAGHGLLRPASRSGEAAQRVSFGTSGHRGSALPRRSTRTISSPPPRRFASTGRARVSTGRSTWAADTHALSEPAQVSALEVLAANGVRVLTDARGGYTPTPAVSQAILAHNASGPRVCAEDRGHALAQPAVGWRLQVQPARWRPGRHRHHAADSGPGERSRQPTAGRRGAASRTRARPRPVTTGRFDFLDAYVSVLGQVIDLDPIRARAAHIGRRPAWRRSVGSWGEIAERDRLDLTVVNPLADAMFRFMTLDWDDNIRMDGSSPPPWPG